MDTFGRLPNEVINLIKDLYQIPIFDVEYEEKRAIYFVMKNNTTINKFILLDIFEWSGIMEIGFHSPDHYVPTKNKHIINIFTQIINKLYINVSFNIELNNSSIVFELNNQHITLKCNYNIIILLNNEDTRKSMCQGLYKVITVVEQFNNIKC